MIKVFRHLGKGAILGKPVVEGIDPDELTKYDRQKYDGIKETYKVKYGCQDYSPYIL